MTEMKKTIQDLSLIITELTEENEKLKGELQEQTELSDYWFHKAQGINKEQGAPNEK